MTLEMSSVSAGSHSEVISIRHPLESALRAAAGALGYGGDVLGRKGFLRLALLERSKKGKATAASDLGIGVLSVSGQRWVFFQKSVVSGCRDSNLPLSLLL